MSWSYSVPLRFRHTAADASGSYIWALRNGAQKKIFLRKLIVLVGFDGTAAATESEYELVRLGSITADSGGTARTPAVRSPGQPASAVTSVRDNAVLTLTGNAVTDTLLAFGNTRNASQAAGPMQFEWDYGDAPMLAADAGAAFALRLNVAAVIGDFFRGMISWEER